MSHLIPISIAHLFRARSKRKLIRPKQGFMLGTMVIIFLGLPNPGASAHTDISVEQAHEFIDSNDRLLVVDVREISEYCSAGGHIPGAVNYPLGSGVLHARYAELPTDRPLLVVCRLGHRSNSAAVFLDSKGYTNTFDMEGGMEAWLWETAGCVDTDGDVVNDDLDNCPNDYNPSQTDSDSDDVGNVCDNDCPNFDGLDPVAFEDFSVFAGLWQATGEDLPADLNADGIVNVGDLAIFVAYWLSDCREQ